MLDAVLVAEDFDLMAELWTAIGSYGVGISCPLEPFRKFRSDVGSGEATEFGDEGIPAKAVDHDEVMGGSSLK